jgi:hypothetical protein
MHHPLLTYGKHFSLHGMAKANVQKLAQLLSSHIDLPTTGYKCQNVGNGPTHNP